MNEQKSGGQMRAPGDECKPSGNGHSLARPEEELESEPGLIGGGSELDLPEEDALGEEDVEVSERAKPVKRPEAKLPFRFDGIQVRMREAKAGRYIIGLDIELASGEATSRGKEISSGEEDEASDSEGQELERHSAEAFSADMDESEDFSEEELSADMDESEGVSEEGLSADSGEQEDFSEEELSADTDEPEGVSEPEGASEEELSAEPG